MQVALKDIPRMEGVAVWWLVLLSIPMFFWIMLQNMARLAAGLIAGWIGALFSILWAPIAAAYVLIDLTLITFWFMGSVIKKMKGK